MSRKQEIYQELLRWSLPELRNSYTLGLCGWFRARRRLLAISELVHNIPVSILEPSFTEHDVWFLNVQAKGFLKSEDFEPYCQLLKELFELVPPSLRLKLERGGPV